MAEFISHEVQVSSSAGSKGHETDHLVQGDASVDKKILRALVHGKIHFLVHKTEDYGLVPDQGLIVTFSIRDGMLLCALVGQLPPDSAHAPLLVRELLNPFDPVVCDAHGHAEVKTDAADTKRCGETGHSAVEIIRIIAEILAETVIPVDHAGDTVEAESVNVIFLHPVFAV